MSVWTGLGAFSLGLVIGWVVYRTLRKSNQPSVSDLTTVVGVLGGASVTRLLATPDVFGVYCIGLLIGFLIYYVAGILLAKPTLRESTRGRKEAAMMMALDYPILTYSLAAELQSSEEAS